MPKAGKAGLWFCAVGVAFISYPQLHSNPVSFERKCCSEFSQFRSKLNRENDICDRSWMEARKVWSGFWLGERVLLCWAQSQANCSDLYVLILARFYADWSVRCLEPFWVLRMALLRLMVGVQMACFFLLPPLAFSAVIGNIFGMFVLLIWGFVCSFMYGYTQARGLVKFRETILGKIYVDEARDSFHIGLLKFNLVIISIFLVAVSARGWSWLDSSSFW